MANGVVVQIDLLKTQYVEAKDVSQADRAAIESWIGTAPEGTGFGLGPDYSRPGFEIAQIPPLTDLMTAGQKVLLLSSSYQTYCLFWVWRFGPDPFHSITGRVFVQGSEIVGEVWDEPQPFDPLPPH